MLTTAKTTPSTVRSILSAHNFPPPTNPIGRLAAEAYSLPCAHVELSEISHLHINCSRDCEDSLCAPMIEAVSIAYDYIVMQESARIIVVGSIRDDIIQEARVGLWKAANKYLPEKDPHFHNFARTVIRNSLLDHIQWIQRDDARREQAYSSSAYARMLETDFQVDNKYENPYYPSALAGSMEYEFSYEDLSKKLRELFHMLNQRAQSFLWLHYVDNWSMRTIAKEFSLSVSRVHAIISESKLYLRDSIIKSHSIKNYS